LGDGSILKIMASLEGKVLGERKNSTNTILESGSAIDEAKVARESA